MLFSTPLLLALGVATQGAWANQDPACDDATLGAVASESSVCSQIGIDVLKEGGNAADAVSSILPCAESANLSERWLRLNSV